MGRMKACRVEWRITEAELQPTTRSLHCDCNEQDGRIGRIGRITATALSVLVAGPLISSAQTFRPEVFILPILPILSCSCFSGFLEPTRNNNYDRMGRMGRMKA